ncbi:MAG: 30S ribosomal protein S16, partial [Candidatus Thermofonsia Clade 3 bacterium]
MSGSACEARPHLAGARCVGARVDGDRIVAADARARRDGRFLERLGTYAPLLPSDHPQRVVLNEERIRYWL